MTEVSVNPEQHSADFVVEDGCASCGGKVHVRVTEGLGAVAYCAACHWLSRPQVNLEGNRLQLAQPGRARA